MNVMKEYHTVFKDINSLLICKYCPKLFIFNNTLLFHMNFEHKPSLTTKNKKAVRYEVCFILIFFYYIKIFNILFFI
jgi:hypothetical protein